ncbi:MAG: hypothetical protein HQK64_05480 [Desulfamplus sp.]|nr:hypothetical protein [Desulfamplus sp.]MBF0388724.1 hypothetical protein [Desulfamplus sp.]
MGMNSVMINGLLICAGGGFVLVFQWIASLMGRSEWTSFLLADFGHDTWVSLLDKLPTGFMQNGFDYLVFELPLWIFLAGLGGLVTVIGSFMEKK